ncbi:MAG: hypothetical protein GJT30_00840 [Geobacter sp.]|nr:hypothetical protein [Geobacter sp.]
MTGKKRLFFLAVMFTLLFALGACSSDDPVTPQNSSTPAITGFSPATAAAGDTITITGTGFSTTPASNTVAFNGTPATVVSSTSTQIVVTVPAGATSGTITVTVGGVTATSSSTITVTTGTGTAGALDTTFGGTGYVTTTIDGIANAIAIQVDGKILVAGSGTDATVVRYNTDGTLDTGFGTAGIATLPAGSSELSIIKGLALDSNGKIVVAGVGTSGGFFRMAAARLNTDGSLDTTFGASGIFYSPFTSNGSYGAQDVAIQADGKIVLVGETADKFAVVRLNTDGSRDTTGFGSPNGYVTTAIQGYSHAQKVAIQGDGKIVVMGQSFLSNFTNFAATVARYNTDGTLDTTFGSPNGYVIDTRLDDPQAMALQSGKIVISGGAIVGPIYQFAMLRFGTDGVSDSTFGTTGLVTTPVGGAGVSGEAYSLALTSGDGIILAGHVSTTPAQIGVARYSSNGVLDTTFGSPDGYVLTSIGTSPYPYAAIIDGNGKIVIAGGQGSGTASYFVVRYLP